MKQALFRKTLAGIALVTFLVGGVDPCAYGLAPEPTFAVDRKAQAQAAVWLECLRTVAEDYLRIRGAGVRPEELAQHITTDGFEQLYRRGVPCELGPVPFREVSADTYAYPFSILGTPCDLTCDLASGAVAARQGRLAAPLEGPAGESSESGGGVQFRLREDVLSSLVSGTALFVDGEKYSRKQKDRSRLIEHVRNAHGVRTFVVPCSDGVIRVFADEALLSALRDRSFSEDDIAALFGPALSDALEFYAVSLPEPFTGEEGLTACLFDRSPNLFEDHEEGGVFGVNRALFDEICLQVHPRDRTAVLSGLLAAAMAHEVMYEISAGFSENMLIRKDAAFLARRWETDGVNIEALTEQLQPYAVRPLYKQAALVSYLESYLNARRSLTRSRDERFPADDPFWEGRYPEQFREGPLDLPAIIESLVRVQGEFPFINIELRSWREHLDNTILRNLILGYRQVNTMLADGRDLNENELLALNTLVLYGDDLGARISGSGDLAETERKLRRYVQALMNWYERQCRQGEDPVKIAAGMFTRILARPQLFREGNHRTASLVASFILVRNGYPPLVISPDNAVEFFNLASEIKFGGVKSHYGRVDGWKEERATIQAFLQRHMSDAYLVHDTGASTEEAATQGESAEDLLAELDATDDQAQRTAIAQDLGLDMRPIRAGLLDPSYVGYSMALCEKVNPEHRPLVAVYGGAGADVASFLLATDATDAYFVDLDPPMGLYVEHILEHEWITLDTLDHSVLYKERKQAFGFGQSPRRAGMVNVDARFVLELKAIGVPLYREDGSRNITVEHTDDDALVVTFDWAYPGRASRRYTITCLRSDMTLPRVYHPRLTARLEHGIDLYYQRAGYSLPAEYASFIGTIAGSVRPGGYLMTDDWGYPSLELFPFDERLAQAGLLFSRPEQTTDPLIERYRNSCSVHNTRSRERLFNARGRDKLSFSRYGWQISLRQRQASDGELFETAGLSAEAGMPTVTTGAERTNVTAGSAGESAETASAAASSAGQDPVRIFSDERLAYLKGIREMINPRGAPCRLLYPHAGADIHHALMTTDFTEAIFIDQSRFGDPSADQVERFAQRIRAMPENFFKGGHDSSPFFATDWGKRYTLRQWIEHVLTDGLGVPADTVRIERLASATDSWAVRFPWAYPGEAPKERIVYFFGSLSTNQLRDPDAYPPVLRTFLEGGVDVVIEKAPHYEVNTGIGDPVAMMIGLTRQYVRIGGYFLGEAPYRYLNPFLYHCVQEQLGDEFFPVALTEEVVRLEGATVDIVGDKGGQHWGYRGVGISQKIGDPSLLATGQRPMSTLIPGAHDLPPASPLMTESTVQQITGEGEKKVALERLL